MQKLKKEYNEFKLLMKSVPAITLTLFVMSVFSMNLLANKSLSLPFEWLALDCGIIVSWIAFLVMDVLTTRFGPKAATEISIAAILFNLCFCGLFFLGSLIAGSWGESYIEGSEAVINNALDRTFGGTWYVLFGSTVAFISSAFVNNFLNYGIGKAFKGNPDSPSAYVLRTYISTAIGQFADNLIFALIVSLNFFGWSLVQCITCAFTGCLVELLCEVLFSFFGYRILNRWKRDGVGKEYLEYKNGRAAHSLPEKI